MCTLCTLGWSPWNSLLVIIPIPTQNNQDHLTPHNRQGPCLHNDHHGQPFTNKTNGLQTFYQPLCWTVDGARFMHKWEIFILLKFYCIDLSFDLENFLKYKKLSNLFLRMYCLIIIVLRGPGPGWGKSGKNLHWSPKWAKRLRLGAESTEPYWTSQTPIMAVMAETQPSCAFCFAPPSSPPSPLSPTPWRSCDPQLVKIKEFSQFPGVKYY